MPRYVVHVRTPMPPAEAFAFMADLNNFARWDPGVDDVDQVEGSGPGPEAVFDVSVKAVMGTMTLRYRLGGHLRGRTHPQRAAALRRPGPGLGVRADR